MPKLATEALKDGHDRTCRRSGGGDRSAGDTASGTAL